MYPLGTIKVTWIKKDDFTILNSQMFKKQDLQSAIKFAENVSENKDFMIFELQSKNDKDGYTWKLLPYGDYKRFIITMENADS